MLFPYGVDVIPLKVVPTHWSSSSHGAESPIGIGLHLPRLPPTVHPSWPWFFTSDALPGSSPHLSRTGPPWAWLGHIPCNAKRPIPIASAASHRKLDKPSPRADRRSLFLVEADRCLAAQGNDCRLGKCSVVPWAGLLCHCPFGVARPAREGRRCRQSAMMEA